ncbi:MAG: S8 family peptidase [Bacteroidales bacterium]|nr:S8 family peptidase [Bacteroidales bacterium]
MKRTMNFRRRIVVLLSFAFCYIGCVAQVNTSKVSSHLVAMETRFSEKGQSESGVEKTPMVNALVTLARPCDAAAFFVAHGCRLIDNVGRIFIVDIPLKNVAELSNNDTIERIEAERMPHPVMDVTPQQVNATGIYTGDNLPQAFTGAGVAAGVFDSYYDFTHPAFQDANGDLRVQYYYDFHWPNSDGTLGHALETAAEIEALEHSQNTRNGIHGTHVMGIMAGSSVNGQYQGMAPEADIYAVDFNSDREEFESADGPTSATAVLGFKKIFDRAEQDHKPCVINFSSCETMILTSQRILEGEALQALVGPGRIIVSAAGNDGTRACYLEKGPSDYQAGTGIKNGIASGQIIEMDLVTPVNQFVRFDFLGIQLTGGGIEGTIKFNTDSISQVNSASFTTTVSMGEVQLDVAVSSYQDPRGTVYHIHGTLPHLTYLVLCGATVLLTGNGPAWIYTDIGYNSLTNINGVPQYCFAQPGHSVSWPANLPRIIAVGATGYKNTFTNIAGQTNDDMLMFAPDQPGHIAQFSSCGPTFDERIKPDVVAPGLNINAAYNSFYGDYEGIKKNLVSTVQYNDKTYHYLAESGTSMASPVVAGIIALWLQAKPDLTPEEALAAIQQTSTHPDNTMAYPNNTYGHGQIDAYQGLLYVLDLPSRIPDLSLNQPQGVTFRLENRMLYVDFGDAHPKRITINVYALDGRLLLTRNGRDRINLSTLKDGVYAVQVITDQRQTTGSTLIRLP